MLISKDMQIEEIVEKYPETIGPLQEMSIQCIICGEPVLGTLEQKARAKGQKNLEKIVDHLNEVVAGREEIIRIEYYEVVFK